MDMLGSRLCQSARHYLRHIDNHTAPIACDSKRKALIRRGGAVATHLVESDKADIEFVATRIAMTPFARHDGRAMLTWIKSLYNERMPLSQRVYLCMFRLVSACIYGKCSDKRVRCA